ncbi:MAG TPA: hypothetical protein PKM57_08675 [Kiritimatiellia bacterium]|nr:hypothetical protein [Kiritimatiellia bacterium]HPS07927.1 hypothetical protein [Kiritimatiellia bacterium]
MSILNKIFGIKNVAQPRYSGVLNWEQLPPISTIALLDADAFNRAPGIIHGMLGFREILADAVKTVFPCDRPDVLKEMLARKGQFLLSFDASAGLAASRLGFATSALCTEHGIEIIESNSDGLGIPALYSATLSDVFGEFHIIVDANLTKEHWQYLSAIIAKDRCPARMGFGKSSDGRYVAAVLHNDVVKAHDLVSIDAGRSFDDFCIGAITRMRKEKVPYDIIPMGQVLAQRSGK